MSISAALKTALAVLPEANRNVRLRGHDAVQWPITTARFAAISLKDEYMVTSMFGVDMSTGQQAAPEQIADARGKMKLTSQAEIIGESFRDPEMVELSHNMTDSERRRHVDIAMELSIAAVGDPESFFGEAAGIAAAAIRLATTLPKEQLEEFARASSSSKATPSSSSSKRSRSSKPASAKRSGSGRRAKSSSTPT